MEDYQRELLEEFLNDMGAYYSFLDWLLDRREDPTWFYEQNEVDEYKK